MSDDELYILLKESRTWNDAHNITGKLVYIEGESEKTQHARFMQVLEGYEMEVEYIFSKIETDPRHHQVVLISRKFRENRSFKNWSMKFEKIDLTDYPDLEFFFDVDAQLLQRPEFAGSDIALEFLKAV